MIFSQSSNWKWGQGVYWRRGHHRERLDFSLARGTPRSRDSLKATAITTNYQESRRQSGEPSKICSYSIKIIKRNNIDHQIGNQTIEVVVTIKRRSNNFSQSWKNINILLFTRQLKFIRNQRFCLWVEAHSTYENSKYKKKLKTRNGSDSTQYHIAQIDEAQILDNDNKAI